MTRYFHCQGEGCDRMLIVHEGVDLDELAARYNWDVSKRLLCEVHKGPPVRQSGLQEAERLINGPRAADYGSFPNEAHKIARIYADLNNRLTMAPADPGSITSGKKAAAREHALYMIVVKLVRESNSHKRDNIVDLQGYAELYLQNCEDTHEEINTQDPHAKPRKGCPLIGCAKEGPHTHEAGGPSQAH